jgi:cytochrome b pre-mRNA-processing protein 3
MTFLSRLFRPRADPREALRPLWHRTVEIAREPEWYAHCGVADTLEGRFDMITAALSLVLLRMENDRMLAAQTGLLTELFVEDMDGQLRQSGVGDLMVGKKIGRLMETLGGRIGAYREALGEEAAERDDALASAARRNVTMADESRAEALAERLLALQARLAATDADRLLEGTMP